MRFIKAKGVMEGVGFVKVGSDKLCPLLRTGRLNILPELAQAEPWDDQRNRYALGSAQYFLPW